VSDEDNEAKTENPTDKRKSDYEEEGKTAFSRELPIFTGLLVLAAYLSNFASFHINQLATDLASFVVILAPSDNSAASFTRFAYALAYAVAVPIGSFLAAVVAVSTISAIQNRPRLVAKRITPEWSRISPGAGFKRLMSANNGFEFLKSVGKISLAVGALAYGLGSFFQDLMMTVQMASFESAKTILPMASSTVWILCCVAGLIAAADFAWQRRKWFQSLRMTKQEVKDEFKQSDGDPTVKSRLRAIARDKSRKRMMQAVPSATLIIANPTHIAVALRYDPAKDAAPIIVAMGADLIAQRIREIAAEYDVPVFERVELARALYRTVKVNQIIPVKFYAALAELIRIINARSRDLRRS
jgi:flagellar biosynthesis protein FlhB